MNVGKISPLDFVIELRNRGCTYDKKNGGILSSKGIPKGKQGTNGYKIIMFQKNGTDYYMCEQRCVWWWFHPETDPALVVDHLNSDRSDNRIENLDAVTMEENMRRMVERGRCNPSRGERSGKTNLKNTDAALIKYLGQEGWPRKDIASFVVGDRAKRPDRTVDRILEGVRFGCVTPFDLWAAYPEIVARTARTDLPIEEQTKNALLGLHGELGEVTELIKKNIYQGHDLNRDDLEEELGDVLFYLTWLMVLVCGIDRAEVMLRNASKLQERYKEKFTVEESLRRIDHDSPQH